MSRVFLPILFFGFIISNCFSQEVLNHEREISEPEKYDFLTIEFDNEEEGFTLSGTLISPKSNFDKVIVIVPGTGKDGRNSHFKLVDSLLQNNIAVYRYDERGVGKSQGNYFNLYLFSGVRQFNDLYYCLEILRDTDLLKDKKIGVLGHSEGGIASIEAYEMGAKIDFFVQWAVPVKPYDIVRYQYQMGSNPKFFETLKIPTEDNEEFIDMVSSVVQENKALKNSVIRKVVDKEAKAMGFNKRQYKGYLSNTLFINLLKRDYESTYSDISVPVFCIIGGLDEIVDPIKNTEILNEIDNSNIDIFVAKDLYHMLSEKSYSKAEPSVYLIDDVALLKIVQWIVKQ